MKRLTSRKSHSWWWDSHISPKNSKWLSENLEKMDRLVKEMLKLIEEEGDTFAKKAEMYYRRRPELISRVEDFYRMYRALAERYDILTGELRKNIPSDLQSQGSGNCSDFGTEPASPSFSLSPDQTPERKQKLPKPLRRAAGFDVFLGSTTSSDFSRKGSDDSSSASSSDSGSESEDGKIVDAFENTSGLNARIIQLEDQLREVREKLKDYEKGSNGQCVHDAKDEIPAVVEVEAKLHPESMDKTPVSETEICNHKSEIKSLKEAMEAAAKQFEAEISLKDHTIEEYKTQLDAAMSKFIQEKSTLEGELKSSIAGLELEAKQLSEKKSSLEIRILEQEQMINDLKVMLAESSEKSLHEKSILESKVCSLMESEKILASKLRALDAVQVESERLSESEDKRAALEAEISNHKGEIKRLKEAMEAAAKQYEAEISVKEHRIEEYKTQLDATINKFMLEKSTLEIRILVLEQKIKELKVMSTESVEKLLHEKNLLESKVCSLMDSVNIHESKLQALQAEFELHPESEDRTVVLEAEISNHKGEIKCLKEAMEAAVKQFEGEISMKDHTIEEYKTQLDEAMNKFMLQNSTLEAELKRSIADLKLEAKQLSEKNSSLEIIILKQEQVIKELKVMSTESSEKLLQEKSILESKVSSLMDSKIIYASKLQALEDRIRDLELEKMEALNVSAKRIDELNQSLDGSKLKIDMLTSEKDELNCRVSRLMDDTKCRDDNLRSMADHLHQLHIEHVNLIKEIEEGRKNSVVLMKRVRELEEDVERQKVIILDGAEGKREAIRQLCFSLDHYRDGYQKLRQMLQGHTKRVAVMAT
ncbi:protein NETWORKED 4B [Dendrobium catenatum]|uniref:NAB domain-containing protein n=1 Tax=Dendrobium catenatum TaxID=906689 RepID=A0A2I0VEP0_9ASPA|nr:protein NETWORKED 4B [Dendrobium catenatum]XP_020705856.1 protein NETWORKED 4B [Dendrobium catenatum]XP_020705857.1 protein NETWORKED 4B [Dendrobium catenatum]XP_028547669.1 protein NETWORKED 4B [Dendrobium catenatum]XP_028547670.1 protein NETWORKED 4B [Dendrobium catenatum]PKU61889.1 hypothetical protein MA16_Dca017222 [Dendrobium catenatum]